MNRYRNPVLDSRSVLQPPFDDSPYIPQPLYPYYAYVSTDGSDEIYTLYPQHAEPDYLPTRPSQFDHFDTQPNSLVRQHHDSHHRRFSSMNDFVPAPATKQPNDPYVADVSRQKQLNQRKAMAEYGRYVQMKNQKLAVDKRNMSRGTWQPTTWHTERSSPVPASSPVPSSGALHRTEPPHILNRRHTSVGLEQKVIPTQRATESGLTEIVNATPVQPPLRKRKSADRVTKPLVSPGQAPELDTSFNTFESVVNQFDKLFQQSQSLQSPTPTSLSWTPGDVATPDRSYKRQRHAEAQPQRSHHESTFESRLLALEQLLDHSARYLSEFERRTLPPPPTIRLSFESATPRPVRIPDTARPPHDSSLSSMKPARSASGVELNPRSSGGKRDSRTLDNLGQRTLHTHTSAVEREPPTSPIVITPTKFPKGDPSRSDPEGREREASIVDKHLLPILELSPLKPSIGKGEVSLPATEATVPPVAHAIVSDSEGVNQMAGKSRLIPLIASDEGKILSERPGKEPVHRPETSDNTVDEAITPTQLLGQLAVGASQDKAPKLSEQERQWAILKQQAERMLKIAQSKHETRVILDKVLQMEDAFKSGLTTRRHSLSDEDSDEPEGVPETESKHEESRVNVVARLAHPRELEEVRSHNFQREQIGGLEEDDLSDIAELVRLEEEPTDPSFLIASSQTSSAKAQEFSASELLPNLTAPVLETEKVAPESPPERQLDNSIGAILQQLVEDVIESAVSPQKQSPVPKAASNPSPSSSPKSRGRPGPGSPERSPTRALNSFVFDFQSELQVSPRSLALRSPDQRSRAQEQGEATALKEEPKDNPSHEVVESTDTDDKEEERLMSRLHQEPRDKSSADLGVSFAHLRPQLSKTKTSEGTEQKSVTVSPTAAGTATNSPTSTSPTSFASPVTTPTPSAATSPASVPTNSLAEAASKSGNLAAAVSAAVSEVDITIPSVVTPVVVVVDSPSGVSTTATIPSREDRTAAVDPVVDALIQSLWRDVVLELETLSLIRKSRSRTKQASGIATSLDPTLKVSDTSLVPEETRPAAEPAVSKVDSSSAFCREYLQKMFASCEPVVKLLADDRPSEDSRDSGRDETISLDVYLSLEQAEEERLKQLGGKANENQQIFDKLLFDCLNETLADLKQQKRRANKFNRYKVSGNEQFGDKLASRRFKLVDYFYDWSPPTDAEIIELILAKLNPPQVVRSSIKGAPPSPGGSAGTVQFPRGVNRPLSNQAQLDSEDVSIVDSILTAERRADSSECEWMDFDDDEDQLVADITEKLLSDIIGDVAKEGKDDESAKEKRG